MIEAHIRSLMAQNGWTNWPKMRQRRELLPGLNLSNTISVSGWAICTDFVAWVDATTVPVLTVNATYAGGIHIYNRTTCNVRIHNVLSGPSVTMACNDVVLFKTKIVLDTTSTSTNHYGSVMIIELTP